MNFLAGLLSESNRTPSSLRVSFLVWEIILVVAFSILIGYTVYSHYSNPTSPFNPSSALTWVASILAANRGSKLIQKPFENNAADDQNLPSPKVHDL